MIVFALELLAINLPYILCFNKFPKLYKYLSIIMLEIHMVFHDHFDTQKHLQLLMTNLPEENTLEVAQAIGLMLYGFDILYGNNEWTYRVYKSHNETIIFLKKFNKKYKQKLTLESIQLPQGLHAVSKAQNILQQDWFVEFCQIDKDNNFKKKSLQMKKKAGGRYFRYQCCSCCTWKECKMIIRNDGLVYLKESKNAIKEFLHFGKDFSYELSSNFNFFQIIIHSYHRRLSLRAKDEKDYLLFVFFLKNTLEQYKKNQVQYRFNSFAPIRFKNQVSLFVDGEDYFESLAHTLESAKQQVFMCGWWISPEFHLIRPCQGKNLDFRLDNLLRRIAKKNVRIYIIVYFESSFLTNDSAYTKQALEQLHENIKVIRHPNIILPTFWSHHQKLIVVDQMIAHMGGLDICYGRYDDQAHSIDNNCQLMYPGIQYNNCRINDFERVRDYRVPNVEREKPRLPWHDVALKVQGQCVKDLSRHFIEYWNYASYQIHYADRYILISKPQSPEKKNNNILDKFKGIAKQIKQRIKHDDSKNNDLENKPENQYNLKREENPSDDSNSPKALSNPKIQEEIREQEIEVNVVPQLKKQTKSIHERIIARLSPLKRDLSPTRPKNKVESAEDIYKKCEIKEENNPPRIMQEIEQQEENWSKTNQFLSPKRSHNKSKPKQIQSALNKYSGQEREKEEEIGMKQTFKSQITMHNFYGEEPSERENLEYMEKYDKFKQSMIKMAEIENKIHKQQEQDHHSIESDFIIEKDHLELKKKEYQHRHESASFQENRIGNWMNKIIKKVRNSSDQRENEDKMKASDVSHKQEKQSEKFVDKCQILRSASQWSIGCKEDNTEMSICEGYLQAIKRAKKYIYIQNQFFISATRNGGVVKNKIMEAIADKIIEAIKMKQEFRVMIIIPLIPGFAGELDDPNAAIPRVIMNWQYRTLSRNPGSLFARINEYTEYPQDYIEVYGLRNHGIIDNTPKTEIVYLHSKLLIIDDQVLICGSANINDRSMQGNRDSQLCLYLDSRPDDTKIFYNEEFSVNTKIHDFRVRLWAQHFGLPPQKVQDPLHPIVKGQMKSIAKTNTLIYRELFGCYPDDTIETLGEIKGFKRSPSIEQYNQKSESIVGHIVEFPLFFLCKEKLTSYHPNAIST